MPIQTLSRLASTIKSLQCRIQRICIPHCVCNLGLSPSSEFSRTFCCASEHTECVPEQLNPLQYMLHSHLCALTVCKAAHVQRTACIAHLSTRSRSMSSADAGLRRNPHLHYHPPRYPSPESDTAQQPRNRTLCSTESWLMPSLKLTSGHLAS